MKNLPQYIDWFRHSSSYINAHRKKVFVVLLPGEAIAHENFNNIVHDITLLHCWKPRSTSSSLLNARA